MRRRGTEPVDAVEAIEGAEQEGRGPAEFGKRRRSRTPGLKAFLVLSMLVVAALMGFLLYQSYLAQNPEAAETARDTSRRIRQVVPSLSLADEPARATVAEEAPEPEPPVELEPEPEPEPERPRAGTQGPPVADTNEPSPADMLRQRRLSSPLDSGSTSGGGASQQASAQGGGADSGFGMGGDGSQTPLSQNLNPVRLEGSSANVLANRDLLITRGTMIDCGLETRLISTQPGMVSCFTTRNVYSASGRVVLIEKGSKLTGSYQGDLKQGQARAFVLWERAETPEGVVIELASPGTGPLGEGGLGGYVDRHLGERFGGAIMISFIGDVGEWLANQGGNSSDGDLTLENTNDGAQQAATEALRNSINIPPTLYKNHGERVAVYVSRDLDFSNVYELQRG